VFRVLMLEKPHAHPSTVHNQGWRVKKLEVIIWLLTWRVLVFIQNHEVAQKSLILSDMKLVPVKR